MNEGDKIAAIGTRVKRVLCSASRRSERCTVYSRGTKLQKVCWPHEEPMIASLKGDEVRVTVDPACTARPAMEVGGKDVEGEREGGGGRGRRNDRDKLYHVPDILDHGVGSGEGAHSLYVDSMRMGVLCKEVIYMVVNVLFPR